jgi:hypothetical protein
MKDKLRPKKWTFTDNRIKQAKKLFASQHSVGYVAASLGVSHTTLLKHLKEHKMTVKELKLEGISKLRANVFEAITRIEQPEKMVKAGLDYLKVYDTTDEVVVDNSKQVIFQVLPKVEE